MKPINYYAVFALIDLKRFLVNNKKMGLCLYMLLMYPGLPYETRLSQKNS